MKFRLFMAVPIWCMVVCWTVAVATQAYCQAVTWATPFPAIKATHPLVAMVAPGLAVPITKETESSPGMTADGLIWWK